MVKKFEFETSVFPDLLCRMANNRNLSKTPHINTILSYFFDKKHVTLSICSFKLLQQVVTNKPHLQTQCCICHHHCTVTRTVNALVLTAYSVCLFFTPFEHSEHFLTKEAHSYYKHINVFIYIYMKFNALAVLLFILVTKLFRLVLSNFPFLTFSLKVRPGSF